MKRILTRDRRMFLTVWIVILTTAIFSAWAGGEVLTNAVPSESGQLNEQEILQVEDELKIEVQPEDMTLGKGATGSLVCEAYASLGAEVSYQWVNADSGEPLSGHTDKEFNLIADNMVAGEYRFACIVSGEGLKSIMSRTAIVTVSEDYLAQISYTATPENISVTQGKISSYLTVKAECSDGAQVAYQWYSSASDRNTRGNAIDGATYAALSVPSNLRKGEYYYYCVASCPTAEDAPSNAILVLVLEPEMEKDARELALTGAVNINLDEPARGSINDLYRNGFSSTVTGEASFLNREGYSNVVSQSYGLSEEMFLQQYQYTNQEENNGAYVGGFDSVPIVLNNGVRDTVKALEIELDGMWFNKAPDTLSITFTDGFNYVNVYSDDKRASDRPTGTKFTANIAGKETRGTLADRHNIIAQPTVMYSPRVRLDKNRSEVSLWVNDQLISRTRLDNLFEMREVRVELRFGSATQNDVSMYVKRISLRIDS